MRQLDAQHQSAEQNFGGVAYSFIVFPPAGRLRRARVFEGRGLNRKPSAQKDRNSATVAVCIIGNYERDALDLRTRWELVRLLRWIRRRKGKLRLRAHSEVVNTACPGRHLRAWIPWLQRKSRLK